MCRESGSGLDWVVAEEAAEVVGGGGGSPFTAAGRFNERPGETTPRAPTPGGSLPAAGSESGGESDAPAAATFLQTLGTLLRKPGQQGGGGGGGFGALGFVSQAFGRPTTGGFGGGAPPVATGDYLVTISVDGKTLTRVLRVERGR
jgi:hypothetical protein